jgi:hypothetical protein
MLSGACGSAGTAVTEVPTSASDPSAPEADATLPPCALEVPDEQEVASLEPKTRYCSFDTRPADVSPSIVAPGPDAGPSVIPIGTAGMERPHLLCRPSIEYTRQAAENHVSGMAFAKCVIDLDGRLCNCRMLHGLPYMDDVILSSLNTWKYTPVLYKGHPQRVYMVIPVRLSAPTAAK